ncbi:MAG: hypothetical protein IPI23_20490 [Bacteroidetes bacterium]|nr:hypothetical protein [Bacteroidota bacterium]
MKKIFFTLLFFTIVTTVSAQKNKISDTTQVWSRYRNAVLFNDLDVAKNALFELIAMQPQVTTHYDSLANIYFRMGAYEQAILAADKAPQRDVLKEIQAYSYRNLGDVKTALPLFESLFTASGSPEHGYQLATLQYSLKRLGECAITASKVSVHHDSKKEKVIISTEQGENMHVSYHAAAENLMGVLYLELGKKELAKESFIKAITDTPEFTLAKKNLASINSEAETPVKQ